MEYELLLMNLMRGVTEKMPHVEECLGQHIIAAYLQQHHFRARVYSGDSSAAKQVIDFEVKHHGVTVVGFYVGSDNVVMIGNLIRWIKKQYPVKVVVGGPEAAALEKTFLQRTGCDYIIVGEGEVPMLQLLSYLEDGIGTLADVPSLRYLEKDTYHTNPLAPLIMDLDSLPYPKRENSLQMDYRMRRSIGILTGRGCPFHCAFCYEGAASKNVRFRSVEHVMEEIDYVRSFNHGLQHVNIFDDTFTLNKERLLRFCREMRKRGLTWTCEGHVSCLYQDPELIPMMIESGLIAIQLGIESGSQRVLDAYHKTITPEMSLEVVRQCKEAGIMSVEGNYIIGGARESWETLQESLSHAKKLLEVGRGIMELNTIYLAPYHGTPIAKAPEQYGLKLCRERMDHALASMQGVVLETEALSTDDIIQAKTWFDQELKQAYFQEAKQCKKTDIYRAKRGTDANNWHWRYAWNEFPHLADFVKHLTETEQTFSEEKYPIRVGIDFHQTTEQDIQAADRTLSGNTARAWLYADGRRTVSEIAAELAIPAAELEAIYRHLNEDCLLYFSEF